jgi:hypothetical protein
MSDTSDTDSDTLGKAQVGSFEQAQDIIEDIRSLNGHIDPTDEDELSNTSFEFQKKTHRKAKKLRRALARYTKT